MRFERELRAVPRVYRVDWSDLRARVSYHSGVEEELRGVVERLGGRIVSVRAARPPLKIMEVDFSAARPPPLALPEDVERFLLWEKFSAVLRSWGIDPELHRDAFESVLRATEGLPLEERQRRLDDLLRKLRPPPTPLEEVAAALGSRVERIERLLEELLGRVVRPPPAPVTREEVEALLSAMLPPPRVVPRRDAAGHVFYGPDEDCMDVLYTSIAHSALISFFTNCPQCRLRLPGGALTPSEFVSYLFRYGYSPPTPVMKRWLERLAREMEEAERGAGART